MKTQTVERHVTVVTVAGEGTVHGKPGVAVVGEKVEKTSISLDEFYRTMAQVDPRDVVWLKDLLNKLADLPIETRVGSKRGVSDAEGFAPVRRAHSIFDHHRDPRGNPCWLLGNTV